MSKQSPRWWKAWQRLAPRFIKSGRSNKLDPHLKVVLDDLERQGLACGPLQSWIPTGSQANALQVAQGEMGKLLNPYFKAHEKSLQRVRSLLGSQQVPKILIPIFEANYLHRRPAPYAGIAKTSSGGAGSGGSSGSSPARQKTTKGIKQVRIAQQRLERARLEMPSATDWGRDSDSFLICIDETWPQKGKHGSEGVIAGVVWQGSEPDFDRLPRAKDHRYASLAAYGILEQLFRCPQALPFIMPIRLDDRAGQASQHYDDLLQASIQIVLGWLLPVDGKPASLKIWMDHDSRHPHGYDQTDFFQGLLRGNQRFARYDIQEVAWYDLDRIDSYIAYADQLAYLARESTKSNRALGEVANFKELPGYVPLTMDLVERLKRLEHLEENGDVESFLDLAVQLQKTRMGDLLVEDVRRRLSDRRDLQLRLLETLDRRYQHRSRDLRKLEKAVDVVQRIVSITPEQQGVRARLLSTAVQFQSANYDGDPHRVTELIAQYESIRDEALEDVPDLAVECDLHLAGVAADRLEFDQAILIAEDWAHDERFPFLPRFLRAKVLTTLGRFLAAGGFHEEAEVRLAQAIQLMDAAAKALPSLGSWREIPAGYRAHNALDQQADDWYEKLQQAVGNPDDLVTSLIEDHDRRQDRYRHRLILRAMTAYGSDPLLRDATDRYVASREDWTMGEGEPWPEIAFYRACILWNVKETQAASKWFDLALITLAARHRGVTMQLLTACVGTAAYCCFDDQHFHDEAVEAIEAVGDSLPAAAAMLQALNNALKRPEPHHLLEVQTQMRFHYH